MKQGPIFFKMDEVNMNMVREELANDIYELNVNHMEEINRMLDEFEDQKIMTTIYLNAHEAEWRR